MGYSDEYIAQLLSGPSLFTEGPSRIPNPKQDLIEKIEHLKKKHVRTELHARMLTEYLKSGIIPLGLQIRNVPGIFSGKINVSEVVSATWPPRVHDTGWSLVWKPLWNMPNKNLRI